MFASFIQSLQKQNITPQNTNRSFQPGQIFHGKVLKLFPQQTAEVQIGNQKMIVKLEVPLSADARYWFQVQPGEGKVHLKVLPMADTGSHSQAPVATGLLKQFNLPLTKENQETVNFFLKEQLPITKASIQGASSLLADNHELKDGLAALKEMVTRNLPLTKNVLAGILSNIKNEPMHNLMETLQTRLSEGVLTRNGQQLLSVLNELIMTGQEKANGKIVSDLMRVWLNPNGNADSQTALSVLQKLSIVERKPEGQLLQELGARLLQNSNSSLSQNASERLARALQNNQDVLVKHALSTELENATGTHSLLSNKAQVSSVVHDAGMDLKMNQANLSEQETTLLNKIIGEAPRMNWEDSKTISDQFKSLVSKLGLDYEHSLAQGFKGGEQQELQKIDALKAMLLQVIGDDVQPSVKEVAEQLLNKITGIQLLSQDSGLVQQYVMQIPLSFWNKTTELTVQWNGRKKENGQIDPDYCRVLFYLDLEYMHEVIVDMQIQNKILNITIINDVKDIKSISQPFIKDLKDNLEKQGFKLSNIHFLSTDEQREKQLKKVPNRIYQSSSYSGVDIKI
ncbi:hypothetical protein EKG37_02735 [Robertmurraya yapensis]|uniref:Flagellar hook-length control protein FliK n=1 Tax=Bacillus yapensis TaxID=2492960 RepID=A0A3S0LHF9_9BACI|nr:hypothetical protein [Bacillus yapensis]RTR35563.1 hypothetical protein EKG37_02735 [Bacillus yapensis]TKS98364.1 hypothetical protein FAR12_02735 [Bacillus yapensis]